MYYLAYCHYNNSDFITSSYLFKNYVSTFRRLHVEECFFMGVLSILRISFLFFRHNLYSKAGGELLYINNILKVVKN